ncbi:MAG: ATP-dependent DNA helicase RecG [Candidatus Moranbacteria bacterium]|nr:ATP-dependent DNA helicase RecG [Candidatus Moranbacteria bacterium]MDD3965218.1 ATP-dependent DNA helicase RecG [Candidatus Moranbacteria bacterium]
MFTFDTPLSHIPTIKEQSLEKLKRLGIFTVSDMLYHFPSRYEDYSHITPIDSLASDAKCTIEGTVLHIEAGQTWKKKMFLTEVTLGDESGQVRLIWFNQRFVAQTLRDGALIRVSGKVSIDSKGLVMTNPAFERASREATHTGRLVPIYPETAGLTSRFFRWQLAGIFQKLALFPDPIPEDILTKLHLPSLKQALFYIHFPKDENQSLIALKRFAFDEMFFIQLKSLELKALFETAKGTPIPYDESSLKQFIASFPFRLTTAQEKASQEILLDLSKTHPMNRLLNGDVGSGKTIVAAIASFVTTEGGYQTAILAPTEILARQHFESLSRIFSHTGHTLALLTGSYHILGRETVKKQTLIQAIHAGIPSLVIGTHAILQQDVVFHNLALIVVDEQHRFGVSQRARLQELSFNSHDGSTEHIPHFLSMTATPIPRTLTLAFFGNLDLSLLDELPKNRKPIITKIARTGSDREKVYTFVQSEVMKGRQVFVIFPLVEESLALKDIKAAVAEHKHLAETVFPHLSIGLIHGKLKAKEKEEIMQDFHEKKYDILVATAVVEVGIDIPNASVIIIEEAERFGLAQLHQFRGRVGRGEHQSYCFLFPHEQASSISEPARNASLNDAGGRLKILEKSTSGFEIAEADLGVRGPGAFFGTRQSGLPDITMESLTNIKLITIARDEAQNILSQDPKLVSHPLLKEALKKFEERIHLE